MRHLVAALLLLSTALGCDRNTSILLVVDGDLRPGLDADSIAVEVREGEETLWQGSADVTAESPLPHTLRIIPGERVAGEIRLHVVASLAGGPTVEATRETLFVDGEAVEERVCLFRRCSGSTASSCRLGLCEEGGDGDADADIDAGSDAEIDATADADGHIDADDAHADAGDARIDAGADAEIDGGFDADAENLCPAGETMCSGDSLHRCDDVRGWVFAQACPLGCNAAEARCFAFQPSNITGDLMGLSTAATVVSAPVTIDTDDCDPSVFPTPLPTATVISTGDGDVELCVLSFTSLTVEADGIVSATGSRGLTLVALDEVTIRGTIDVSARLDVPGAGGWSGGAAETYGLRPLCGGGGGEHVAEIDDSGGGGGGHGGQGGAGAVGGAARGGFGGFGHGAESLVPPTGGCGGGGGGSDTPGSREGGAGGAGGGFIQISAAGSIFVGSTAQVLAGGGGGGGSGVFSGGGGGGAGGGILLEAMELSVDGLLAANGGGGGGGSVLFDRGEDGTDGLASDLPAPGGAGGGAAGAPGAEGGAGISADGDAATADGHSNGGGGGGAVGRIRLSSRTGEMAVTGTVSPTTPETFTTGTITLF